MSQHESELRDRLSRAAGHFAIESSTFTRGNLVRAMRRALDAGFDRDQVIALTVLPREEAEQLLPV